MKILVTDYAWKDLEIESAILQKIGATMVAAETGSEEELVELAPEAEGILTNWKRVFQKVIAHAPRCKVISRFGVGLDNIDVSFATSVGIVVTNVPDYCVEEVSDHALALLLALARKVVLFDRANKSGEYNLQAGTPIYRIKGKTLGIVGFGKIGRMVYQKARALGLRVIACERRPKSTSGLEAEVKRVSFNDLLRHSDFVSIHLPLTPETRHLFNLEALRQMKPTAFLINTARGDIVHRDALLKALEDGLIAGAGLDVLSQEPPEPGDRLVAHPKVIVTPHAAFNSEEAVEDLRRITASQMADLLTGKIPNNVVNPQVLQQPNLRLNRNWARRFARQSTAGLLRAKRPPSPAQGVDA